MKKFLGIVMILSGVFGGAGGLWLLHQKYLVGRLYENHAAQISDGRISQELYRQESLLAWRDLTMHLGLLVASSSLVYLGGTLSRRKTPPGANGER